MISLIYDCTMDWHMLMLKSWKDYCLEVNKLMNYSNASSKIGRVDSLMKCLEPKFLQTGLKELRNYVGVYSQNN